MTVTLDTILDLFDDEPPVIVKDTKVILPIEVGTKAVEVIKLNPDIQVVQNIDAAAPENEPLSYVSIKRGRRWYRPFYKSGKLDGYTFPSLKIDEEDIIDLFDKNFNHTGSYYKFFNR